MIQSDTGLILLDWPAPPQVTAGYTLRGRPVQGFGKEAVKRLGASQAPFDNFNLAHHVGDDPDAVNHNRQLLVEQVGKPLCWLSQTHSNRVVQAGAASLGLEADAAWVDDDQWAAVVMTADCLPVFFCNAAGSWAAVAHAGWRGLAAGILPQTLSRYSGAPESLMAYLGPAIGPTAFDVGDDVRDAFGDLDLQNVQAFQPGHTSGKWWADIYALARLQLQQHGVHRIYGGGYCTFREAERFFSYRRDGTTGRMANAIWID